MTPLCFVDCETTGLHPARRAWEVAIIRRDDHGQREHVWQVAREDLDLGNADPIGLKMGRFYERHEDYVSTNLEASATGREQWIAFGVEALTRGAHLVGAVPDFDARTLDAMLRRHGFLPAWHYHLIDVEAMAVGWLHGHAVGRTAATEGEVQGIAPSVATPPWKSDDLSRACGVEPPDDAERHTALGDARWAMRWYDAMTGGDPDA